MFTILFGTCHHETSFKKQGLWHCALMATYASGASAVLIHRTIMLGNAFFLASRTTARPSAKLTQRAQTSKVANVRQCNNNKHHPVPTHTKPAPSSKRLHVSQSAALSIFLQLPGKHGTEGMYCTFKFHWIAQISRATLCCWTSSNSRVKVVNGIVDLLLVVRLY